MTGGKATNNFLGRENEEREREKENHLHLPGSILAMSGAQGGAKLASQPVKHFVNQSPVVVVKCEFGDLKPRGQKLVLLLLLSGIMVFFFEYDFQRVSERERAAPRSL
jgi:hypothetical protein